MSRPTLTICTRCDEGDRLYERVRAARKARDLKEVFKVEEVRCLRCCRSSIACELAGKKRSTYTRVELRPDDADALVDAMVAYAALPPGAELPERVLPGEED